MINKYADRCLTCKHWEGDKKKTQQLIALHGRIAMSLTQGFCGSGDCYILYEWMDITVHGDATYSTEINANFGCIRHEPD